MNSTDTRSWLETHGLAEFAAVFEQNHLTPDMMASLTADDLSGIGITSLGHRKKLLAAIGSLNAPSVVPPPADPHPVAVLVALPPPTQNAVVPQSIARAPSTQPKAAPMPQPTADALEEALPPSPDSDQSKKPKRKGFSPGFLAVSIALHVVLGLGAGYWVVQQINAKRKLQFSAGPPTTSPSKRALEHKVSLQKKKNAGGAPAQARRIAVAGLAANITLPEMPAMPSSSTQIVAGRMAGMGGAGFGTGMGFGNGSGMGMGGIGNGAGITFFGLRSQAKSIVFVLDSSQSNVGGSGKSPATYRELEAEVFKTLKMLQPSSQFGVILYAPKMWTFKDKLAPATAENLKAAEKFINDYSVADAREGKGKTTFAEHLGTRMDLAVDKVFELRPDTIIWVSDGMPTAPPGFKGPQNELLSMLLKRIDKLQKPSTKPGVTGKSVATTINTFAYKLGTGKNKTLDDAREFMSDIAKENGGKFTEVK